MDWTAQVDNYCERLGPGLWAEPLNLVSNLAFIIAALIMHRRCRGMARGELLSVLLFVIGVGSALFHSVATRWAGLADTLPIVVFILAYLYAANRDFLGQTVGESAGLTFVFFPYAWFAIPVARLIPGIGSSAAYAPVPALIFLYAVIMAFRRSATAVNLAIGAAILSLSIFFRTLDMPLCDGWPEGTHFLWHLLNGIMLGWMIETWRRHVLARRALEAGGAGR